MAIFSQFGIHHALFWLVAAVLFVVIFYKLKEFLRIYRHIKKIPGPKGYPLVGNVDWIFLKPVEMFATLREYAKTFYPIFKLTIAPGSVVFIASPDDIETVASQMKHTEKGGMYVPLHNWLKEGLLLSDGAKWQHRRKLLTPTFHFTILNQFTRVFTDESNKLVEDIKAVSNEPVDVFSVITKFTLQSICETAMGTRLEENKAGDTYRDAITKTIPLVVERWVSPWQYSDFLHKLTPNYWKSRSLLKHLHKFTMNVIKQREASFDLEDMEPKGNDFAPRKRMAMLDLLLSAKMKGDNIDDGGIQEEVDTFMFEGHDTTATSLTFSLMLLANHKDIQEKVCEEIRFILEGSKRDFTMEDLNEMKYLDRVIKESLRLYPSVPYISRMLSEDMVTSNGYCIPKGADVILTIYNMHHNPMFYEDPEQFNPDRFTAENMKGKHPYAYIPFSAGPRNCIGQRFAVLEMKAAIATILRHFELHPVDTPETIKLQLDIILRSTKPILVDFRKRRADSF